MKESQQRGGLAGEKLAADHRKKESASGTQGKMLTALDEWRESNRGDFGAYPPSPLQMVDKFRKLIEETL